MSGPVQTARRTAGKAPRFLVVDDEPEGRALVIGVILAHYPAAVIRAASSNAEAYQILLGFAPDIVVTELSRKGRGGLRVSAQDPPESATGPDPGGAQLAPGRPGGCLRDIRRGAARGGLPACFAGGDAGGPLRVAPGAQCRRGMRKKRGQSPFSDREQRTEAVQGGGATCGS